MPYNYQILANIKVTVLRYGAKTIVEGIVQREGITKVVMDGSISPVTNLTNIKKQFGVQVTSAINYSSKLGNQINIETDNTSADVIYWDNKFWKVVSSINHRLVLKHTEGIAVLITHTPQELLDTIA